MPLPVSLRDVVDEMDIGGSEATAYLNRVTGELMTVLHDEMAMIEDGESFDDLADWEREIMQMVAAVAESEDFLPLPSSFDIHEHEMMVRFCHTVADDRLAADLRQHLHRSRTFRRFKDAVHRHGVADDWSAYRQRAFEEIAVAWLEENGIAFVRA